MEITYKLLGNCPIHGTPLDSIMKIVDDGEKTKNYFVPCDPANTEHLKIQIGIEDFSVILEILAI